MGALLRALKRQQRRVLREGVLEKGRDLGRLGVEAAVELNGREEARGDLSEEFRGLVPVAPA